PWFVVSLKPFGPCSWRGSSGRACRKRLRHGPLRSGVVRSPARALTGLRASWPGHRRPVCEGSASLLRQTWFEQQPQRVGAKPGHERIGTNFACGTGHELTHRNSNYCRVARDWGNEIRDRGTGPTLVLIELQYWSPV